MKAFILLFLVSGAALADDTAIRACRTVTETAARLNCYDKIELAATPVTRPAKPVATPTPVQSFGLPPAPMAVQAQPQAITSIDSAIVGNFDGWGPSTVFTLANGQKWKVVDGSEAVLPRTSNQKVTISRNFIGTMFMKVDGTNSSPKVRRLE